MNSNKTKKYTVISDVKPKEVIKECVTIKNVGRKWKYKKFSIISIDCKDTEGKKKNTGRPGRKQIIGQ